MPTPSSPPDLQPPTPSSLPPDRLPGNDLPLTDGERDALAGFDLDGNPVADTAIAPTPVAEAPPVAPAPAAATDVTPPAAPPAPATPPPSLLADVPAHGPAGYNVTLGAPRDFNAELLALKRANEAGTLEDEAFETQREALIVDRTKHETMATLQEQFAAQNWENSCQQFLALPQNAILLRDPDKLLMFDAMTQAVVDERAAHGQPPLQVWNLLVAAGERLYKTLGLTAPAPTHDPVQPTPPTTPDPPNRNPDLTAVPPGLGVAPAAAGAGGPGDTSIEAILQSGDLSALELRFAGMSPDAMDALLAQTAGRFVDD